MPRLVLVALVWSGSSFAENVPGDFDCAARTMMLEFAQSAQPFRSKEALFQLADALDGSPEKGGGQGRESCNVSAAAHALPPTGREWAGRFPEDRATDSEPMDAWIYAAITGSDSTGDGSRAKPFATVAKALAATRASGPGGTIVLGGGVYYLAEPLILTPRDSGLTIQSDKGSEAWLSGGLPLTDLQWNPHNVSAAGSNVWAASLAHLGVREVTGLRLINGSLTKRLTRARWPNNPDPEAIGFGASVQVRSRFCCVASCASCYSRRLGAHPRGQAASWMPRTHGAAFSLLDVARSVVSRNDTLTSWQTYTLGIGGTCDVFDPPVGYCTLVLVREPRARLRAWRARYCAVRV